MKSIRINEKVTFEAARVIVQPITLEGEVKLLVSYYDECMVLIFEQVIGKFKLSL